MAKMKAKMPKEKAPKMGKKMGKGYEAKKMRGTKRK